MPMYTGCMNCGRTVSSSKSSNFCPDCGSKDFKTVFDERELPNMAQKQKDFALYKKLKEKFE